MTLKLAYKSYGAGPPIVIVHGLFGSGRNWHTCAKKLSTQYCVIAVDLRNHGRSPWADTMTFSQMVDDVHALLDSLGVRSATLLGHSMGGKVAMLYALLYGHVVDALIVVDIAPARYTNTFSEYIDALERLDLSGHPNRRELESKLADAIPDTATRKFLLQNLVSRRGQFTWRINLKAIEQHMADIMGFPQLDDLPFEGPTLFVRGDRSDYLLPRHEEDIRAIFPLAEFAVIEDAGHRVHAEQLGRFLDCIEAFLQQT